MGSHFKSICFTFSVHKYRRGRLGRYSAQSQPRAFAGRNCHTVSFLNTYKYVVPLIKYSTGMLYTIVWYVRLSVRSSVFTITHERVDVE